MGEECNILGSSSPLDDPEYMGKAAALAIVYLKMEADKDPYSKDFYTDIDRTNDTHYMETRTAIELLATSGNLQTSTTVGDLFNRILEKSDTKRYDAYNILPSERESTITELKNGLNSDMLRHGRKQIKA